MKHIWTGQETGKRKYRVFWLAAVFIGLNLMGLAAAFRTYPQFAIEREALFGAENGNLKDFQVTEDGRLKALSDDPWIYYPLGEPVSIRNITAEVSGVSRAGTKAQFYLMPSLGYQETELENGRLSVCFSRFQGRTGVGGIRLDMATEEGTVLAVERVVVNRRAAVALDFEKCFGTALGLTALLLAEAAGWLRLAAAPVPGAGEMLPGRGSVQRRRLMLCACAVLQAAAKLLLLWVLRDALTDRYAADRAYLLSWMLALGLECFSILTLYLGTGYRRGNIWYGFLLAVPFAFVQFAAAELLNLTAFDFETPAYLCLNLLLCALVPSILLLITRRGAASLTASSALFTVWSVANHYYGILRDNPLEYFDMANAKTAVNVVGNYTFEIDGPTAAAFLAAAVIGLTAFGTLGVKGCGYRIKTVMGNAALVAAAAVVFVTGVPVFGNFSNLQIISREKGYLLSFASFIKMGQVKRPEGYTAEQAEEILKAAWEQAGTAERNPEKLPNIIVIMDEAFADLPSLYGFETSVDALPKLHAMTENTIHGKILVSVYGGGTANTEYEFLTGNSLYFFPMGSSPYVQYVSGHQQSLAWKLGALGYSRAAYHPYLAISYRRESAYPLLGLEPFYSIDDDLPYGDCVRSYVSDRSDFQNIIYLYENRQEEQPFFLFNVTMQNHGGYSSGEPEMEATVIPEEEALQEASLLEYLALIHETDAAFGELTDYFSGVEEDTIILMFGDHQPSMSGEVNEALDRLAAADGAEPDPQRRYYATFVIWANFDIEEKTDVVSSPGYLRSLLLEAAGVELNAYEQFLLELSEEYPAINAFGCLDSRGVWHDREEEARGRLQEYQYLVYQNVFDGRSLADTYYE